MVAPEPDKAELDAAFADLQRIHRTHLAQHNVKLPEPNSQKAWQLSILHHAKGELVHKDTVSRIVRQYLPNAAADQQVRHLKRDGWNITGSRGYHALKDPFRPSEEYANERARRQGRLNADTWDEVKQTFGNRCATCGAVDGEPDPRYGADRVQLQQGHQDPESASDDPLNIIPQCQYCNRAYRSDFVFDDKGRVTAVASLRPVRRARLSVQKAIQKFLNDKLGLPPDSDKNVD